MIALSGAGPLEAKSAPAHKPANRHAVQAHPAKPKAAKARHAAKRTRRPSRPKRSGLKMRVKRPSRPARPDRSDHPRKTVHRSFHASRHRNRPGVHHPWLTQRLVVNKRTQRVKHRSYDASVVHRPILKLSPGNVSSPSAASNRAQSALHQASASASVQHAAGRKEAAARENVAVSGTAGSFDILRNDLPENTPEDMEHRIEHEIVTGKATPDSDEKPVSNAAIPSVATLVSPAASPNGPVVSAEQPVPINSSSEGYVPTPETDAASSSLEALRK